MTREQRIEAAARARYEHTYGLSWLAAPAETRAAHMNDVAETLTAAIPEIMSDPPTGWVAPMEATEAMLDEFASAHRSTIKRNWGYMRSAHLRAARDAYTKEQT